MSPDDVVEIRRVALERLRNSRFEGNASALARALDRDPNQVREWLAGGRNISEKMARYIERRLELAPGSLDANARTAIDELRRDEQVLLWKYRSASPAGRMAIQNFAGLSDDARSGFADQLLAAMFVTPVPDDKLGPEWWNPDTRPKHVKKI